jgi:hypothetical protein
VKIWQIYFQEVQRDCLDPGFEPFDNSQDRAEALEFEVFQRLWRGPETAGLSHWGALSWRFGEKTGLASEDLSQAIAADPGVDVFFMNPHPKDEALFESSWVQGEVWHPGLLELAQALLAGLGWPREEVYRLMHASSYSLCNYFIGTPRFWSSYMPFVERSLAWAEAHLSSDLLRRLHSSEADWMHRHSGATFIPFLIERLFSVYIKREGKHLKAKQLRLPKREALMSRELCEIRDIKHAAMLSGSGRIIDQWRKAREAHLRRYQSQAWCDRFMPQLTTCPVIL